MHHNVLFATARQEGLFCSFYSFIKPGGNVCQKITDTFYI